MRRPASPRLRLPTFDRLPDSAAPAAAIAVLGAWLALTPIPSMYGLPAQAAWLIVIAGGAAGVVLGARSGHLGDAAILGLLVLATLAAAALGLLILPRLHVQPSSAATFGLAVAAASALVGAAVGRVRNVGLRARELLVAGSVAAFLVGDWVVLRGQGMRDLRLYLDAGHHYLSGEQVYISTHLTSLPSDPTELPFLYPPMTIPFFAALAALPQGPVILAWLSTSAAASVLALRAFGVRWPWVPVLLLWPPFFEGLWVGNVAVPALLLFAAGPRLGAALPPGATFKVQSAIPSLWLVRERRWRSLATGLGVLLAFALVTLPFVGLNAWRAWLDALRLFQGFEDAVPALYGAALPRHLPYVAFLAVALAAVGAAMIAGRGRRGLARLGIASVVASPSLYRHGFLVVLPGLLANGETMFWLALGIGFTPTATGWWLSTSIGWWLTAGIAVVGTFRWASAGTRARGTLHPLGRQREPWA